MHDIALQIPSLVGLVHSLIGYGLQQAERNAHCLQTNCFRSGRKLIAKVELLAVHEKQQQGISGIKVAQQIQMIHKSTYWLLYNDDV